MLFVMAHDDDADAADEFAEEEMIGEALQVDPSPIGRREMKVLRVFVGEADGQVQFLPKLVAEVPVDAVVGARNSGYVALNGRMVNDGQRRRSRSTRRTNSSCEIAPTRPDSRSRSRCSTSALDTSVPGGGSVSRSFAANAARSRTGKARASSSITASFIGWKIQTAEALCNCGAHSALRS